MRHAPVLVLDQCIEVAPGCEIARHAGQPGERGLDRRANGRARGSVARELGLQFAGATMSQRAPGSETGEGITDLLQHRVGIPQNGRVMQRADR